MKPIRNLIRFFTVPKEIVNSGDGKEQRSNQQIFGFVSEKRMSGFKKVSECVIHI